MYTHAYIYIYIYIYMYTCIYIYIYIVYYRMKPRDVSSSVLALKVRALTWVISAFNFGNAGIPEGSHPIR